MPSSKTINKAVRAGERKRLRNHSVRSNVKTHIAKVEKLANAKSELAYQEAKIAIGNIDKAVNKGIFHRNKGARLKSQLMRKLGEGIASSQSPDSEQGEEEGAVEQS